MFQLLEAQTEASLISANTPDLDYLRLVRQAKKLNVTGLPSLKLALLSDAATQQFVPLLRALFQENGVALEIYEAPFDAMELEAINPDSGLYQFRPDVVLLAHCTQALRGRYYGNGGGDFLRQSSEQITGLWSTIQTRCSARIVQCNFPLPYERQFGHFDLKVAHSLYSSVSELNMRLAEAAREQGNVLLCDVEALSSTIGRKYWFDDRLWNMSKAFCRLEYLPQVAQALVEIVLATRGRVVKCVVLDLDNTLWGGVVGDDGANSVAIGPHGDGEAFYHFQQFLLSLKQRGILLAVCSKNNYDTALLPFAENPGMVLRRDDITVFIANWENKAGNIRKIRDTLEIGLDSMVFLDDNAFERNLVRQMLPGVIVPEMPEDPADYVRALCECNLFETSSFSAEDMARADLYQQEAGRREQRANYASVGEYLESLDMRIEVGRFTKAKLPRIAQLLQRSNQFNLTTRRHNEAECERMRLDWQGCIPLCASLSDRLGDHGLISIVILERTPDALVIRDWLMSCRVLTRGVEQFLMNEVVEIAQQNGYKIILGEYVPTAKNAMVQDFFAQFGFENIAVTHWRLDVANYVVNETYIQPALEPVFAESN